MKAQTSVKLGNEYSDAAAKPPRSQNPVLLIVVVT